jgi:hypothetical protein
MPTTVIGIMETLKGLLQGALPVPPLLVTKPERQLKLRLILTRAGLGRSMKSNFVDILHKKSKRVPSTPESVLPLKRQRVTVTPSTPRLSRRPPPRYFSSLSLSSSVDCRGGSTNDAIAEVMYGNL